MTPLHPLPSGGQQRPLSTLSPPGRGWRGAGRTTRQGGVRLNRDATTVPGPASQSFTVR
jgi:hypothetical protein